MTARITVERGDLHYTQLGETGPRIVLLHGLFGQGKNWTSIAKALERTVDDLCARRPASMTLLSHSKEAGTYRGRLNAGRVGP